MAVVILMGAIGRPRPEFPGTNGTLVPLDMSVAIQTIMFAVAIFVIAALTTSQSAATRTIVLIG